MDSFDLLFDSLALDGLFSYFCSLVQSMHNPDTSDVTLHESDAVWIFCDILLTPVLEYLAKAPRLPQRLPQMGLTGLAPSMAYAHARR